ncbi:hypothetical protein BC829DRAFT_426345 [Chytridium lagenaria]|nr:hypothetical protein BC829DRAFT_426345 [Chytridium lagenaria]
MKLGPSSSNILSQVRCNSTIPLTSLRHPNIHRGPYSKLTDTDISTFRSILSNAGPTAVLTNPDEVLSYNEDWMRKYRGQSTLVLRPKTSQEVSEILAYCNARRLAVVPQGGNTGLVGGSVAVFDEVVVSTVNMTQIEEFDEVSGILTCQAGCVLEVLDNWLAEKGFMMPLDLGAKGTCQIGGNVATNAGGLRLLRYGSLHGTVLSLEVVTPDGKIVNLGQPLRKDNTGFDLKQLFIGSEGTLGIITKVSILTRRSSSINAVNFKPFQYTAVLRLPSYTHGTRPLLPTSPDSFYVLIETSGSNETHDSEKLMGFLDKVMGDGIVDEGTLADSVAQKAAMWRFRESIGEACGEGCWGWEFKAVGFGHMGDGNLHLNVTGTKWDDEVVKAVEPFVYEWVEKRRGSISAEHGLGKDAIAMMKDLKKLWDPNGIMNPYKFLPSD